MRAARARASGVAGRSAPDRSSRQRAPGGISLAAAGGMGPEREAELNDLVEELRAEREHWLRELETRQSLAHALSEHLVEPDDVAALGAAQRDTDRLEPM